MTKPGRKPRVVPGDVLDLFKDREDRAEPLTASEIGNALNCARKTAYNKLQALEEDEEIASKKVGGRSRVYWIPIREHVDNRPRDDETPLSENNLTDGSATVESNPLGNESNPIGDVDFPAGRDRAECEAAIFAAQDYLQDNGPASMREIVAAVMPDYSLGYEVPEIKDGELAVDRYRGAWWRKVVKPGLRALPEIEAAAGGGKWRYTRE